MMTRTILTIIAFSALASIPGLATAMESPGAPQPRAFLTRAILTGNSDESRPAGYTFYSAIGLEVAIRRDLGSSASLEFLAAIESHEVDEASDDGFGPLNLGSIETLPMDLLVLFRPLDGRSVHPYAGGGVNATIFWEKSGSLDGTEIAPSIGPALAIGADFDLSPNALINLNLRWNYLEPEIEAGGARRFRLEVHPLALGAGLGFRF